MNPESELGSELGTAAPRPGGHDLRFAVGLGAVAALAAGLRLVHLGALGLGSDEAVYATQGRALLASLGGADAGSAWWPAVRAHPPLLGLLVALLPGGASSDVAPRVLTVCFALITVVLTGLLGRRLAGNLAGLLAAGVLAVTPYAVDVSRQVLLDVPMATATTAALLLAAGWTLRRERRQAVAAGVLLAVATLFKETAVLTALAVLAALLGAAHTRDERADLARGAAAYAVVAALQPAALVVSGHAGASLAYLGWQLGRGPTVHEGGWFYATTALPRVGLLVLLAAVAGAVIALRRRDMTGEAYRVVAAAAAVPAAFDAVWPTKGYPYLAAVLPPVSVLAAVAMTASLRWSVRPAGSRWARTALVSLGSAVLLAAVPATASAAPPPVPAADGVPLIREAAQWIAGQRSAGPVLAADPAVANIVRFYSSTPTSALVPADVARLNPAYRTPANSNRTDAAAYFVWDRWTAVQHPDLARRLLVLAHAAGARPVAVAAAGARDQVVIYAPGREARPPAELRAPSPVPSASLSATLDSSDSGPPAVWLEILAGVVVVAALVGPLLLRRRGRSRTGRDR